MNATLPQRLAAALRRRIHSWSGAGPWRALPLAELLARRHPPGSWHAPESLDGVIARVDHPPATWTPGVSLLGQTWNSFRMEGNLNRYVAAGTAPAQSTHFWSLEAAGVIGQDGLVYCPRCRAAVAETARTIFRAPTDHSALAIEPGEARRLAGLSLLLASPFGHAHYHFLWDNLARLALLPPAVRGAVNHYLLHAEPSAAVRSWLQASGVPLDRVVWLAPASHFLCDQVIFASLPALVCQPRRDIAQALHQLVGSPAPAKRERWLWISRRGQSQRDLRWEQQLLDGLAKFERLDLARLSAPEQIAAFAGAAVIAGPHGSGFANLAFVGGQGHFVELFPSTSSQDPLYGRLAQEMGWAHAWAQVDFDRPDMLAALTAALKERLGSP